MSAPRLLFVSHSGAVSGAERVLLSIAPAFPGAGAFIFEDGEFSRQLQEAGLAVVYPRGAGGKSNKGGLSQARRNSSLLTALPMAGKLAGILRDLIRATRNYDLVYANSQKAFTLAALASVITGKPLIWHLHDIMSAAHFGAGQRRMQIFLANKTTACVIVPSRATAEAFIAAGGRADRLRMIANGVVDIFGRAQENRENAAPATSEHARAALGLAFPPNACDAIGTSGNRKMIGVFSRLSPWKGQDVVLRALARLPDVTGVFAGAALFGEQAYADDLQALVRRLGLSDRVVFLGHRSDVPALMQAMDIVVHPSIDPEPFGLTLVEAMLAGVPLIASDAGAAAEILDGGRYGLLTPPGDDAALAQAIESIFSAQSGYSDAKDACSIRTQAARSHACDVYSLVRMNAAIVSTVASIAGAIEDSPAAASPPGRPKT